MPRANRRRRQQPRGDLGRVAGLVTGSVEYDGGRRSVRQVGGNDTGRSYRCPGCQHQVSARTPHTVVWPEDGMAGIGGVDARRHWHTACWQARDRRPPRGSWK